MTSLRSMARPSPQPALGRLGATGGAANVPRPVGTDARGTTAACSPPCASAVAFLLRATAPRERSSIGNDFRSWIRRRSPGAGIPGVIGRDGAPSRGTNPAPLLARPFVRGYVGSAGEGSMRRLMGALSVKAKLSLAPAVLGMLVLALWGALYGMASITKRNDERIAVEMEKSRALGDAMALSQEIKAA